MTDPAPVSIRKHFDAIAAHLGAYNPDAGEHKRGVLDLLTALEDAANRCAETGAKFSLVAISAPDLPAIEGARKCVLWAQQVSKSKGKTNG